MRTSKYDKIAELYSSSISGCSDFRSIYYAQEIFVEKAKSILEGCRYAQEFVTYTDYECNTRYIHIFSWQDNGRTRLFVARF